MATTASAATARPSVIQLAIKEKAALYAAYISAFFEGGVFVPTTRSYQLGDDVYLLLTLLDDPTRYPIAGKVAWITPANASGNRPQGIGVRFPNDDKARELKAKIEAALGANLGSNKTTHTL
jgi:type IV pilus assembly protein PilZ